MLWTYAVFIRVTIATLVRELWKLSLSRVQSSINQRVLEAENFLSGWAFPWCWVRAPYLLTDWINKPLSIIWKKKRKNELLENTKQKLWHGNLQGKVDEDIVKSHPHLFCMNCNLLVQTTGLSEYFERSHPGSVEMNLTSIHEDAGSIPGLTQWVKDLALPWPVF